VFDLVANLRVHLAALSLISLGVLLLTSARRTVTAAAALAAAVNLALVAPFLIPGTPADRAAGGETLTITFLNVKISAADPTSVITYLRERDDDVVVLAAGTRDWVEQLDAADLDLHVAVGPARGLPIELIVMTRDPEPPVVIHQPTGRSRDALVEVVVDLDGEPIHILGTHPTSPLTPHRAYRRDLLLDWTGDWARGRDEQVVVVGDLNATPWSWSFRAMLDEGELTDTQRIHGLQPSWPASLGPLGLPIDHVLHGGELTVLERERGPSFGSDHRSVHATIARRATS
jgi:endonuclease/exonuclease/phosphatase (EEP) superfamily protein YafD